MVGLSIRYVYHLKNAVPDSLHAVLRSTLIGDGRII